MSAAYSGALSRANVLLIEDEEAIRESLVWVFEHNGLSVSCAPNGREALDRLRSEPPPEVIVLDLIMPVMNGWQFREEQLTDERLKAIPTIVISAMWVGGHFVKEALGCVSYVRKPFDPATLVNTINRVRATTNARPK